METILKAKEVGIIYVECETPHEMGACLQMALNAELAVEKVDSVFEFLINFGKYEAAFQKGFKIVKFSPICATIARGNGIPKSARVTFKDWFKTQLVTIAEEYHLRKQ